MWASMIRRVLKVPPCGSIRVLLQQVCGWACARFERITWNFFRRHEWTNIGCNHATVADAEHSHVSSIRGSRDLLRYVIQPPHDTCVADNDDTSSIENRRHIGSRSVRCWHGVFRECCRQQVLHDGLDNASPTERDAGVGVGVGASAITQPHVRGTVWYPHNSLLVKIWIAFSRIAENSF